MKRGDQGLMFRHSFIIDGILVLQKEGKDSEPSLFYNENVIPDGDVKSYLIKGKITLRWKV